MSHPQVRRLDAGDVLQRIAAAGGPRFVSVRPMGYGAVGTHVVRWPDGHLGVLKWAPPLLPGAAPGMLDRAVAMAALARDAGIPVPAEEAVITLPEGDVAIVQALAPGVTVVGAPEPALVDAMIDLVERRRHLARGHPLATSPSPLHLQSDGPGFALHGPLADHSDRTRALLARVRAIGFGPGADELPGDDVVHFDFHFENVLVDPDDPTRVTAVVDWDGARPGDVAIDLAVLVLDLAKRAPGSGLAERVERRLEETTEPALAERVWAHISLRTVDWSIRHETGADVEHWLSTVERRLGL